MIKSDSILDWVIIGGGIHGTYLANTLIWHRITRSCDLRIIDPYHELLAGWKRVTANVGMKYLRSPKVHHLDPKPFSLKHFIQQNEYSEKPFIIPNDRPSLKLFNRHAKSVIRKSDLEKLRIKGWVERVEPGASYHTIHIHSDCFRTKNMILATGNGSPEWPSWAKRLKCDGAQIHHIYETSFNKNSIPDHGTVLIVGGGMSAVQVALSLKSEKRKIVILSPHSLKISNYDIDPGWMGPKFLRKFNYTNCYQQRRLMINRARNTGSITEELYRSLLVSIKQNFCTYRNDKVKEADLILKDLISITLKSGQKIGANYIILATGYRKSVSTIPFSKGLNEGFELPAAPCGFPILNSNLEWGRGIFVSGALSELEIGPAARNIIGARLTAQRIIRSCDKKMAS